MDTSVFYALLDGDDAHHAGAVESWGRESLREGFLVTTNYIVLESLALLQARLGMSAVRTFHEAVLPVVRLEWIDETVHSLALSTFVAVGRRGLSLVDTTSFEVMRRLGIRNALTFDRHFKEFGFETLPRPPRGRS